MSRSQVWLQVATRPHAKVVSYGYTQQFAVNPKVQVFWNGAPVGSVKKGDCTSFDIKADGVSSWLRDSCLRRRTGSDLPKQERARFQTAVSVHRIDILSRTECDSN